MSGARKFLFLTNIQVTRATSLQNANSMSRQATFYSLQAFMYLALRVCIMQALCQGRQLSIPYKHLCISRHENCRRAILCVLVNRDCSLQTLFYFAKIGRTLITCSIPASSLNVFSGTAPSTSMIL